MSHGSLSRGANGFDASNRAAFEFLRPAPSFWVYARIYSFDRAIRAQLLVPSGRVTRNRSQAFGLMDFFPREALKFNLVRSRRPEAR